MLKNKYNQGNKRPVYWNYKTLLYKTQRNEKSFCVYGSKEKYFWKWQFYLKQYTDLV